MQHVRTEVMLMFFFKQKTAYEMRISDWSSDVCSSDLSGRRRKVGTDEKAVPLEAWACRMCGKEKAMQKFDFLVIESDQTRVSSVLSALQFLGYRQIRRASCRTRVCQYV